MRDWEARFWSKIDKSGQCWIWTAGKRQNGYGQFGIGYKKFYPHRLAHEILVGPIPDGYVIDHLCHVKACVNPAHLRAVTQKQNSENRDHSTAGSSSGVLGVTWHRKGRKWVVNVKHNYKNHYGGLYADLNEAAEAAKALRLSLFTHNDADRKLA